MSDLEKLERIQSMYEQYRRKFPEVASIDPTQLEELRHGEREIVLVDVREPLEQEVSMIPGAIRSSEFEQRKEEFRGDLVVTYCTAGYRSGLFARKLQEQGWQVMNLAGSLLAYTHSHLPLVDADGPTRRIHVYGPEWNLAARGYESVW